MTCDITINDDLLLFHYVSEIVLVKTKTPNWISNPKGWLFELSPTDGDILVEVIVSGKFGEASLFQYDWTSNKNNIFQTIYEEGLMRPFPDSGIPTAQLSKPIHLFVSQPYSLIGVTVAYAYLKTTSKQKLANYRAKNGHGVVIKHESGMKYQVMHPDYLGTTHNYIAPF